MSFKTQLISQKFLVKHDRFYEAWKQLKHHGIIRDWRGEHIPRTFVEILDAIGLKAHVDKDGDVCELEVDELNNRDDYLSVFLKELAPYVASGSKLVFFDEHSIRTTYKFTNGSVTERSLDMSALGDDEE